MRSYREEWYEAQCQWILWLQDNFCIVPQMQWFTDSGLRSLPLIIGMIWFSGDARKGIALCKLYFVSSYLCSVLKLVFLAPRPVWIDSRILVLSGASGFGMPSGHTLIFSTVLLGIVYRGAPAVSKALAIGLIGLMGFSRIYLGVHFVGDVVAAVILSWFLVHYFWKEISRSSSYGPVQRMDFLRSAVIGILSVTVCLATWWVAHSREVPETWPVRIDSIHVIEGSMHGLMGLFGLKLGQYHWDRFQSCRKVHGGPSRVAAFLYTCLSYYVVKGFCIEIGFRGGVGVAQTMESIAVGITAWISTVGVVWIFGKRVVVRD